MNDLKNLETRIRSFEFILAFLQKKKLAEKYPAIETIYALIQNRLDKIKKSGLGLKPLGRSNAKAETKRHLSSIAHKVSCGVYAYAQITGNTVLKNAVYYAFSDFNRPDENTMLGRCRQVLNAARRIKNAEQFGLTEEVIQNLGFQLEKYIECMNNPINGIKKHARAMRQSKILLKQCLHIIQHQLDPLIEVLDCTEKNLLMEYDIRRKKKKPVGRKRKYVKSGKYKKASTKKIIALAPTVKIPFANLAEALN